ncbi:MAG TPA: hypothetical protein VHJ82_07205 [Actinomycetota bacterium]|nr:hypothetical protein [Actinomycetota bacterium]
MRGRAISTLVLILVVAGITYLVTTKLFRDTPVEAFVGEGEWQAVILSNDRVYFGRLSELDDDFFLLVDAYFLREQLDTQEDPVRQVASLRLELHSPQDRMLINREEVVLVENLSADSPVIETIEQLEASEASN